MRLSKIKIAGFKSFVDPTTINLRSNLTGIVGPNGCGKSNTIDAVRWVMGESSAKHLRGEAMTDVIFNGSTARKPVGKASVELVFDNSGKSAQKLGGEWAAYDEIAVKRQVTRDGKANYFLNGSKCRRRDITDIFLGTGLGPRSYAIIEQGTIARIIEAKPEELRVFLEEAAGISKYKERRRETETRMRHTRENLDRLNDLRGELGKQLERLQRQAATAEKYKGLKNQEQQIRSHVMGLRLQALIDDVAKTELQLREQSISNEAGVAQLRAIESELEQGRQSQAQANEKLNATQAEFYQVSSEISQLESEIRHHRELIQRQEHERKQLSHGAEEVKKEHKRDQLALDTLLVDLAQLEPQLEAAKQAEDSASKESLDAEAALNEWQQQWNEHAQAAAEPRRAIEVEQAKTNHLERETEQRTKRLERLNQDLAALSPEQSQQKAAQLETQLATATENHQQAEVASQQLRQEIEQAREQERLLSQQLNQLRLEAQQTQGRIASLETLQQAAIGDEDKETQAWLSNHQLTDSPKLAQLITVDDGWDAAVEKVLGQYLQAVVVDDLSDLSEALNQLNNASVSLIERCAEEAVTPADNSLLGKVKSDIPLNGLLGHIQLADTLEEAMQIRQTLQPSQRVVTREGQLFGANFIQQRGDDDPSLGVLSREQALRDFIISQKQQQQDLQSLQQQHEQATSEKRQREGKLSELQAATNAAHRQVSQLQAQLQSEQSQLKQQMLRQQQLTDDILSLRNQLAEDVELIKQSKLKREEAEQKIIKAEQSAELLQSQRQQHNQRLSSARQRCNQQREQVQELRIKIERQRNESKNKQANIERLAQQLEKLKRREQAITESLGKNGDPVASRETILRDKIAVRELAEKSLSNAREQLDQIEQALRSSEQKRMQQEQAHSEQRRMFDAAGLAHQAAETRLQSQREQIAEAGFQVDLLLEQLPEDMGIEAAEAALAQVQKRSERLGPINLAAIDEFAQESERKSYLDAQHDDLISALETLESAIAKIDRETRARFRDTFDKVNAGFQDMFPRLFGGGEAALEMTGDDLLSAGVNVMARPPGKRNSTIHLLSGGEKALTAVALVFSIFQLNPAPFCMLDEVDAPLDDANVGRFSKLVREMSDSVQFIFITHNKVTMETAQQLAGVTMQEPGVSRLVSVDVEEAVRLAG